MNFKKQIWTLFKLNRNDFNIADRKIEQILMDVFEQGKKAGRKETLKSMQIHIDELLKK